MIWGLLKRIITFGTVAPGARWMTVRVVDRWPQVVSVRAATSTAATRDRWPQVVEVRMHP